MLPLPGYIRFFKIRFIVCVTCVGHISGGQDNFRSWISPSTWSWTLVRLAESAFIYWTFLWGPMLCLRQNGALKSRLAWNLPSSNLYLWSVGIAVQCCCSWLCLPTFSKVYVYFIFLRWLNCWKWLGMDHGLSGQHGVKMFRVLHLDFLILFETYCFL